jgi:surface polysaccharide O-acyltransferase-like enzyme
MIPSKRLIYADVIRVYALFLVIFSHVFASYCQNLDEYGRGTWWMANIMDTLIRPCVPLFFMISGLLLLDPSKSEPLSLFFKKRVKKILIPFVAWSILYALWFAYWYGTRFRWETTFRTMLQEPISYHLWFIYELAGLYLVTPILRNFVKTAQKIEKFYFVGLWVFSVCVPLLLQRFFGINFGGWLVVATGYVGYFLLGQFLKEVHLNDETKRPVFLSMIMLYLFGAAATYHLSIMNMGHLDAIFYEYRSPNVIAVSVLTFLWMKSLPYEKFFDRFGWLRPVIHHLSVLSFGIYLMHMMVYEGLANGLFGFTLDEKTFNPPAGVLLTTFVVLLIGGAITAVLQKIPVAKEIVPG